MTISYRDGASGDGAVLDRVFDSSFCGTFAHLYSREDLASFLSSFGIADWEAQLASPDYAFRVAEADREIVAYVKLAPMKLPVKTERKALLLDQIYVLIGHHGAGIGRHLLDWAIAEARRRAAEELYLTVFVDNHRARDLYRRYGFADVGPYKYMVGNHADDDIIMRLAL
jgi:ribosomal protein S18 acetylase RimI-like enzyme